jgi:hypothetical protein
LIPKKPLFKDRVKKPATGITSAITEWGHLNQGPVKHQSPPQPSQQIQIQQQKQQQQEQEQQQQDQQQQKEKNTQEVVHESIIAPSGAHIVDETRALSFDLVASVMKESRYKETTIHPGNPPLHPEYLRSSPQDIHNSILTFWKRYNTPYDPLVYARLERIFGERSFALIPVRIFMCYIQPVCERAGESTPREEHYDLLRYRLFEGWLELMQEEEYAVLKEIKLADLLSRCFFAWERIVRELDEEGLVTQKDWELRDLILQRAEMWRIAEGDKVLMAKEVEGWRELWSVGRYGWLEYQGSEEWNPPVEEDTRFVGDVVIDSTVENA